jgi:predicted transcriptional regulator
MSPNWDLISFVKASEIRYNTLASLEKGAKTPTELKESFGVPISRISAILKELVDVDLVENLTPSRRKSKMYGLTKKGQSILSEILKVASSGEK